MSPQRAVGTLYICPTPIGNLEDITERVKKVLSSVDVVAAEDTRHTRRLLTALGLQATLISYHEHNEEQRAAELVRRLQAGQTVALVSDAGTPGIADPGYRLVRQAVEAGIPVVPLPGPMAAVVALSASGLPTDRFAFLGFIPRRAQERRRLFEHLLHLEMTSILYETPQRIRRSLTELAALMPDRRVVIARELTKQFEEFLRGTAAELAAAFPAEKERGELVLLIAPAPADTATDLEARAANLPLAAQFQVLIDAGIDRMEAVKILARGHGLPKNVVYKRVLT